MNSGNGKKRNQGEEGKAIRRLNNGDNCRVTYRIPLKLMPYLRAVTSGVLALRSTWQFPDVDELLNSESEYKSFYVTREAYGVIDKIHDVTGKTKREVVIAAIMRARDTVANPLFESMTELTRPPLHTPKPRTHKNTAIPSFQQNGKAE